MKNQPNRMCFKHGLLAGAVTGTVLGLASGVLLTSLYFNKKTIHADTILETVKKAFLSEGPIEGSWIHLTKDPLQRFAIKTQTYTGGISRMEDGQLVQYEFVADAYTGTVLDIYRL
ncbi:PepSY domain-containing protein [Vagococcus acidifermentans]|uniref:Peptidase n=1 Tax=Vagococcus acidifermentans TaxID=564710 RepID=A0A430ANP6_9ENTE|nr:peptidase [Vagococcus acidifermentans]